MALLTELKLIPADSFPLCVLACACARSYKDASDRFCRMISRWFKRIRDTREFETNSTNEELLRTSNISEFFLVIKKKGFFDLINNCETLTSILENYQIIWN